MSGCRAVPLIFALLCALTAVRAQSGEDEALFGDLPRVEAATLHAQTLAEAPANVTVITAADIRRYGYRTLAEALNSVRGFYATYDHAYHYVGVHGISLPGDYNTRFLVMLNGHPLTDNIYNSNGLFGQDFGLDMDLVERIEIIRGPTSALYGSNGMLANINVVTRSPVDGERLAASSETTSDGERKVSLSSSMYLGRGANLLVSASAFDNRGLSFSGSELGLPVPSVPDADGERGYHTFAQLIWRGWSFTAYFNSRDKQFPVGSGSSLSGDPWQHVLDSRNFLGAAYKRQAGPGELRLQFYYDQYRYDDRFDYPEDGAITPVRDFNRGDWLDGQLTYELPLPGVGPLTMGIEGFGDLRNQQYNVVDGIVEGIPGWPDAGGALFAQQQWNVAPRWTLYGGVRFDDTRNFHRFVSPRVAAVFQSSPRTAWKFVYGRPFRNPSSFEQFYNDGGLSYTAAPALLPEAAHTFEASLERRLAGGLTLVVNGFDYLINRIIEGEDIGGGVLQYRNAGSLRSAGVEFELSGKWDRVQAQASSVWQSAVGGRPRERLPNAPVQVSKFRVGAPFLRDRLFVSGALAYLSERRTAGGDSLGGPLVADATATFHAHPRFDIQFGARNAFDRGYEDPIYLSMDRLRGDGRSIFVSLLWRVLE